MIASLHLPHHSLQARAGDKTAARDEEDGILRQASSLRSLAIAAVCAAEREQRLRIAAMINFF